MLSKKREKPVKHKRFVGRTRLALLYIVGVLVPLILTDTLLLSVVVSNEREKTAIEMHNEADSVQYLLETSFSEALGVARKIFVNEEMNKFLEASYASEYEFYDKCYEIKKDVMDFFTAGSDASVSEIVLYVNNPTMVNGGFLRKLEVAESEKWYEGYTDYGKNTYVSCYYVGDEQLTASRRRRIALIREMDYFRTSIRNKLVRVEIDYSTFVRKLNRMKYVYPVYICIGDEIIASTEGHSNANEPFEILNGEENFAREQVWNAYGQEFRILIKNPPESVLGRISDYKSFMIAALILNILIPLIMITFINQSYENRIARQQSDIARQNAELLAMQSQINPHFLFNVLESMRMHSVLKSEGETAAMIEKLSVLVRQNVNWTDDTTTIADEVKFIEDYLKLQKYRFGDKLSYSIELDDDCRDIMIPRLTMVTFVENSCVHGMEKKTSPTWIYVRIYCKDGILVMEIEDTGNGMSEADVTKLNDSMNNSSIDDLKKQSHIGIINACIRFRMNSDDRARFEIESEEGVGTFTVISVPLEAIEKGNTHES